MRLGGSLGGWSRLAVPMAHASALLNVCMRYRMMYWDWCVDGDTCTAYLSVSARDAGRLCRLCAVRCIDIRVVRRGGVPHLLWLYRRRVGLLVGALLGTAIMIAAGRVLWDIRISGNEVLTQRQVLAQLRESGVTIGMPLSSLDTDRAEMQILLDSEDISWVAINMAGTVAYVEIRERVPVPPTQTLQPANLVARCDGIVEGLEIFTGRAVVGTGQGVREGELLVSGLYDSQAVGMRVTRAAGRVLARTVHTFSVEIPLCYEQKVYVGEPLVQKSLIFFEKEIKLFKKTGILGGSCDKICNVEQFTMRDGGVLPIAWQTQLLLTYEMRPATRTYDCAQVLAYAELSRQLAATLPDAQLLRKTLTSELTDTAYVLHCTVECLEDIAQQMEFSVVGADEPPCG